MDESEFSIVRFFGLSWRRTDYSVDHLVQLRFHWTCLGSDIAVTIGEGGKRTTYNFNHVTFVAVYLPVPNYLMAK